MSSNKKLVLVSQLDPAIEDPEFKDLYKSASISNLLQLIKAARWNNEGSCRRP